MCGRYTLRRPDRLPTPAEVLKQIDERRREQTGGAQARILEPRYNVAPSQPVIVIGRDAEGEEAVRVATWGFRAKWLSDDRKAPINARAETAATTPMFRNAFRHGRCLVPADGWFEWQPQERGPKVPFFFHRPDDGLFWFAGLAATDAQGERTVAILTTDANEKAQAIHSRMPAMLPDAEAAAAWIEPEADGAALEKLLLPAGEDVVDAYPVSRHVNKPANDDPSCVEPVQE
jgi:putative SOS response-associated peptidase YedK